MWLAQNQSRSRTIGPPPAGLANHRRLSRFAWSSPMPWATSASSTLFDWSPGDEKLPKNWPAHRLLPSRGIMLTRTPPDSTSAVLPE